MHGSGLVDVTGRQWGESDVMGGNRHQISVGRSGPFSQTPVFRWRHTSPPQLIVSRISVIDMSARTREPGPDGLWGARSSQSVATEGGNG